MTQSLLQGKTALVTGASSGLGADIARELATRGADLILVARRGHRLQALQDELSRERRIRVTHFSVNLALESERTQFYADVTAAGHQVDLLINNAGVGVFGEFQTIDWARSNEMLQLNVVATAHLTRLFLPHMILRGHGSVMLLGSTASFVPSPGYAAYCGSKAFVLNFGHALNVELRSSGVSCTVVCPGPTDTEFLHISGQKKTQYHQSRMMSSPDVARIAVAQMIAGAPEIIVGPKNARSIFLSRFLSRSRLANLAWRAMRNPP